MNYKAILVLSLLLSLCIFGIFAFCVIRDFSRELDSEIPIQRICALIPDVESFPLDKIESIEETSSEQTTATSEQSYTEYELDLLSRLISAEGSSESYDTKLKIGSVVLNRVLDPNFPDTIYDVIYEEYQFSVTTLKVNGIPMIDHPATNDSRLAAEELLRYGSVLPSDVLVFYAEGKCEGNWVLTRAVYTVCDSTVFAYIYSRNT